MSAQGPTGSVNGDQKRQIEHLLRETQKLVSQAFDQAPDQRAATPDLIEYHSDLDYFELASAMFESVRHQVLFVNGQLNGFATADIVRFRRRIAALAGRGITVSLVCHPDELAGHGRQRFLEEIVSQDNADVRISTIKLHGMFIFDRKCVLMWTNQRNKDCLLVRSPTIVEAVLRLTDTAWETACDLQTFLRCRTTELDEKTPQILKLLSSGCKDEIAARELGISVRTYRRYVADLMTKLDAGSRFQAGVKAASLGLISPDTED